MSDPVTNAEIEDVLSSIRRLVSTDRRDEAPAPDAEGRAAEKLVLSPALRVTEAEALRDEGHDELAQPEEEIALTVAKPETGANWAGMTVTETEPEPAVFIHSEIADTVDLQEPSEIDEAKTEEELPDAVAFLEPTSDDESVDVAEDDERAAEDEPEDFAEFAEPVVDDELSDFADFREASGDDEQTDASEFDDPAAEDASTDVLEFGEPELDDEPSDIAEFRETTVEDELPEPAEPNEPAVDELLSEAEAASDLDDSFKFDAPSDADTSQDEDATHDGGGEEMQDAPDHQLGAEQASVAEILKARVAEFEAKVAEREDQWEPDGTSGDDYAGDPAETAVPWEDVDSIESLTATEPQEKTTPEPEASAEDQAPAEESASAETAPDPDLWDAEEAVIDEDALRDMVVEIVRQELQGALGERITRNVRKLVRREIHRALASQELE